MSDEILKSVVSSRVRLRIADLLSSRPRTLRELASLTGISVQGVLKHLGKLEELGLASRQRVRAGEMGVRKVYSAKGTHIGDYSAGDLTVVKLSRYRPRPVTSTDPVRELEEVSEGLLLQKRRIRDSSRRLRRLIDELVEDQARMEGLITSLDLTDEERLIIQTAFSEESLEEAEKALKEHHGVADARRALEKALSKARRVAKK